MKGIIKFLKKMTVQILRHYLPRRSIVWNTSGSFVSPLANDDGCPTELISIALISVLVLERYRLTQDFTKTVVTFSPFMLVSIANFRRSGSTLVSKFRNSRSQQTLKIHILISAERPIGGVFEYRLRDSMVGAPWALHRL